MRSPAPLASPPSASAGTARGLADISVDIYIERGVPLAKDVSMPKKFPGEFQRDVVAVVRRVARRVRDRCRLRDLRDHVEAMVGPGRHRTSPS